MNWTFSDGIISNIGHSVNALWLHFDDSVSNDSLLKLQNLHVSILSVCSFAGRLLSGKYPTALFHAHKAHTRSRCRIRFLGQGPPCQQNLVSSCGRHDLLYRPNLRVKHYQPAPPRPRIRSVWARVRLPVRRVPVHRS